MTSLFDSNVLNKIRDDLKSSKETVAVAESVTSGLLQWAFSQMDDAACFYQGGITVYNLAQKTKHLNVEPIHANEVNCVSQVVSDKMALEVCNAFLSDWGIGITGYATPIPQSGQQVFAFYSIACKGKIVESGRIDERLQDAWIVQNSFVSKVLAQLQRHLKA